VSEFPNLTQAENVRALELQEQMEDARSFAMNAILRGDISTARAAFDMQRGILDEQVSLVLGRPLSRL
jgi:hypothetical protein